MRNLIARRGVRRWGLIGLLFAVALIIVGFVYSGPMAYRPYHSLAVLMREPLDLYRFSADFYHGAFRSRGRSLLICPANICTSAEKIDLKPPVFNQPAEALMERLDAVIMAEPGAGAAYLPPGDDLRRRYIMRAPPLGLPETIDLIVIPVDDTHATFALYARDLIRELAPDRSERTARWLKSLRDAQ